MIINQPDKNLELRTCDEPGPGGANHNYAIKLIANDDTRYIYFQKGPIKEVGLNGITNESLLELVLHRLNAFQNGPFNCKENAIAADGVNTALEALYSRTRDRQTRGVEGKNEV